MQKRRWGNTLRVSTAKKLPLFLAFIVLFFGNATKSIAGDVVINEFFSNGSTDWVELYNVSDSVIDLSTYRIRDSTSSNKIDLSGTINPHGFSAFDWSNNLNNSGDIIKLVSKQEDAVIFDQVAYGDQGNDVGAPAVNQSAGRITDGSGSFAILSSLSKGSTNSISSVVQSTPTLDPPTNTPTKVPTPTKTLTPTRNPTPTKTPTPIKTSTPAKLSSTATKTPIPTIKPTAKSAQFVSERDITSLPPLSKSYPTAVLGASDSASSATPTPIQSGVKVKAQTTQKSSNPFLLILPVLGLVFLGVSIFYYIKRKREGKV